ncbi:MAG: amidase [Actinobacteria bacterium]|nr:amidase [Actinomycetota bacterium]
MVSAESDRVHRGDLREPTDLTEFSAVDLARLVQARKVSAREVTTAHLIRIGELNGALNALTLVDVDQAFDAAAQLDERLRRSPSAPAGALAGVPFVVKDNIDVHGQATTSGSRAHDGVAAIADATVVDRLREQGAILVGRANMDELAMGASTQTSAYGLTRNPVDRRRSPGGSSGGCAAALAAGLVPLAVGTDTGGSIREPASQCGVVGMAPSPDLVPMTGVVPFAPRLDRVGPLARTVADARCLLAVLAGDGAGSPAERTPGTSESLFSSSRTVPTRVAVVEELVTGRNRPDVLGSFEAWLDRLRDHGVEVCRVSVPEAHRALSAYMRLTSVAALDWLEPWVRSGRAGEELVRRYDYGRRLRDHDSAALAGAAQVQRRVRDQVISALVRHEVLVSPTMPTTAPLLDGEITPEELADPLAAPYTDCWTVVANLAGVPALSVPAPSSGLPVGAMLMGRPGCDADLLALAHETR